MEKLLSDATGMTVSIHHRGYGGDVVITYRMLDQLEEPAAGCSDRRRRPHVHAGSNLNLAEALSVPETTVIVPFYQQDTGILTVPRSLRNPPKI